MVSQTLYGADGTTVIDKTAANLRNSVFEYSAEKLVKVAIDVEVDGSTGTRTSDTDSASISQDDVTFIQNKAASNPDTKLQVNLKDGIVASLDAKAIATLGNAAATMKVWTCST